jgi:hypothetical protein
MSEGVRPSPVRALAVAASEFAAGTVVALSELATLRGASTVLSMPSKPTRPHPASQHRRAVLVGLPVLDEPGSA